MKLRSLTLVCCLLLFAHSPVAQTGTPGVDPISGTWTGHMGRGEGDRLPITVTLKFDGKSLSGTIVGPPNPGTIRTGSFDQASGALKFDVIVQDDSKTVAHFEGKVVNDTATGSVTLNGQTGTFTMTKGAATATAPVQPQPGGLGTDAACRKASPRSAATSPNRRT